jgi:hypothetical protein
MSMTPDALEPLASTTKSLIIEKFGHWIVERWTRYRAKQFFRAFINGLQTEQAVGHEMPEVDQRLDAILADETKSELLFDAYRRVCFSKSKDLGPRIIGFLTAELVLEGRMATQGEESIFEAAENLSDGEFKDFLKAYQEYRGKAAGIIDRSAEVCSLGESIIIRWYKQELDMHSEAELGPFPWVEALGPWAVKLNRTGLITDRMRQKANPMAGVHGMEFETHVTFEAPCGKLFRLVVRSIRSIPGE